MRVDIFQEELGEGVEIIAQTSRNGKKFYGLRVWLKTCQSVLGIGRACAHAVVDPSTPEDDDRSAVTFWYERKSDLDILISNMRGALAKSGIVTMTEKEARAFLLGCEHARLHQQANPFPFTGNPDLERKAYDRGYYGMELYQRNPRLFADPRLSTVIPVTLRPSL